MQNITQKFSNNLKDCLRQAKKIADQKQQTIVSLNFFLLALLNQKGSLAFEILTQKKINSDQLKTQLLDPKYNIKLKTKSGFGPNLKKLFLRSFVLAQKHQHYFVGTEHCLAVLLDKPPGVLNQIFEKHNIDKNKLKNQVTALLRGNSKFPELTQFFQGNKLNSLDNDYSAINNNNLLDYFATSLTDEKVQVTINPVIKRETEIKRLIQILCRKDKNNPVILGDPGVGKTALVEGLAKKILQKQVPNILLNKKILALDLSLIVAGTMYRGDFENRLKIILDEVKNNPNIILFIDELHNIIGAGSASGSLDAANILKPLLARGNLRCIGATTMEEFKKFIEKDPALERRFQPIILSEPTTDQAIEILHGIKENYQLYHGVVFTDNAIQAAVNYSDRYIKDKLLPDKAIDLIDEAAAKSKIQNSNNEAFSQIKKLEIELEQIIANKNQAVRQEQFNHALKSKQQEKLIFDKLQQQQQNQKQYSSDNPLIIKQKHILEIIAEKTKIPIAELGNQEKTKLKNLPQALKNQVVGQDQIINQVCQIINRARVGLADEIKPMASLMFLGPSGVGKTYLAKNIAEQFFNDKEAFIRIDMSEFSEKFNATKLVGAPAGYVGYRETNKLTDAVKKRPYSLILLDEIEKAHPDVISLLLQILEDGHLTDATGKQINFKNTIIIMTSNLGLENLTQKGFIGFNDQTDTNIWQEKLLDEAKKVFRPEFLNRLDQVLCFNPLTLKDIKKIIKLHLQTVAKKLKQKGLLINVSDKKIIQLAKQSIELDSGARAVRKVIIDQIENPIAESLLKTKKQKVFEIT